MVKPAATWFVIATLALVTTSAQPLGDYSASTSTLKMRASVSDGSLIWEFKRRAGPKVSIKIEFPLEGDSDKYTVDYPDFGLFKSLFTSAFPEVQMQDGDLTDLAQYSLISFQTVLAGEELIFFREGLPLRGGIYVYDQGDSFRLTLRITPASVFMTFRCPDASRGKRFSDLTVGGATNIQFLPGGDADPSDSDSEASSAAWRKIVQDLTCRRGGNLHFLYSQLRQVESTCN
ncbi:hypothetical protein FOL46_003496 [Perkinsus olseni]|uniref:Uncharacterized protein n=1 Tax=Perkinsus olseni TaxID=32597 RepID=A0A7J6M3H7_PEROL|nr:hypothetical protein FOL46_003496 [Perkinsus olseni]